MAGSLRVRKTRPGDQRKRSDRDQKAIRHYPLSSRLCIARADNGRRRQSFRQIPGSVSFVF
jgi:hypothetical protein